MDNQRENTDNRNNEREDFRKRVREGVDWLKQVEDRARNLANQNLADIAAAARGRLQQLRDHPDLDLLHDDKLRDRVEQRNDRTEYKDPHPSTAVPANGTQGANAPKPFPGTQVGGPDQGKPDVYRPGDTRFDRPNEGFTQPNAVDLNPDGTLRQAPNTTGAADVRKG